MNKVNAAVSRELLPFVRKSSAPLTLAFPRYKGFAHHECLRTLEIEPTSDFATYDFFLSADADLQTIGLELPMLPGVVRVAEIDIFSQTNHVFPYWRCSASTEFRGMVEPVPAKRWILDGALIMIPSQNQRLISIFPSTLPEGDRTVRISLAFETELSPSLLHSLERHFTKFSAMAIRNAATRQAEAQELLETIRLKDAQLARQVNALKGIRFLCRRSVTSLRNLKLRLSSRLRAALS